MGNDKEKEIRLIDANALKETLNNLCSGSNRITVRRIEDCMLHDIFPRIINDEPTIEFEPLEHDTELSSILQDYGINDADTLRYILDQYQRIIVEITGGQMSYLTYPAQAVIECANDYYLSALANFKEDKDD